MIHSVCVCVYVCVVVFGLIFFLRHNLLTVPGIVLNRQLRITCQWFVIFFSIDVVTHFPKFNDHPPRQAAFIEIPLLKWLSTQALESHDLKSNPAPTALHDIGQVT